MQNRSVLQFLAGLATIGATVVAAAPLVAGITRSPRLRRAEQQFRDAAQATTDPRQREILLSLHQWTAARIVAGHLTPWWQIWWPVLAWLLFLALGAQSGWVSASYLIESQHPSWTGLTSETAGDPVTFYFTLLIYPVLLASFYSLFADATAFRASIATQYMSGDSSLTRRVSLMVREKAVVGGVSIGRIRRNGLLLGAGTYLLSTSIGLMWGLRGADIDVETDTIAKDVVGVALVALTVGLVSILHSTTTLTLNLQPFEPPLQHPTGAHQWPKDAEPTEPQPPKVPPSVAGSQSRLGREPSVSAGQRAPAFMTARCPLSRTSWAWARSTSAKGVPRWTAMIMPFDEPRQADEAGPVGKTREGRGRWEGARHGQSTVVSPRGVVLDQRTHEGVHRPGRGGRADDDVPDGRQRPRPRRAHAQDQRTPGRPVESLRHAVLPDGSRLHVVIPDITRAHWNVNIRKFVVRASHLDDLVALGTLTPQAATFLGAAVAAGLNILVAGGTQAGNPTNSKSPHCRFAARAQDGRL